MEHMRERERALGERHRCARRWDLRFSPMDINLRQCTSGVIACRHGRPHRRCARGSLSACAPSMRSVVVLMLSAPRTRNRGFHMKMVAMARHRSDLPQWPRPYVDLDSRRREHDAMREASTLANEERQAGMVYIWRRGSNHRAWRRFWESGSDHSSTSCRGIHHEGSWEPTSTRHDRSSKVSPRVRVSFWSQVSNWGNLHS
jgi:hypothetical protein